jgi:hypothetical protein
LKRVYIFFNFLVTKSCYTTHTHTHTHTHTVIQKYRITDYYNKSVHFIILTHITNHSFSLNLKPKHSSTHEVFRCIPMKRKLFLNIVDSYISQRYIWTADFSFCLMECWQTPSFDKDPWKILTFCLMVTLLWLFCCPWWCVNSDYSYILSYYVVAQYSKMLFSHNFYFILILKTESPLCWNNVHESCNTATVRNMSKVSNFAIKMIKICPKMEKV